MFDILLEQIVVPHRLLVDSFDLKMMILMKKMKKMKRKMMMMMMMVAGMVEMIKMQLKMMRMAIKKMMMKVVKMKMKIDIVLRDNLETLPEAADLLLIVVIVAVVKIVVYDVHVSFLVWHYWPDALSYSVLTVAMIYVTILCLIMTRMTDKNERSRNDHPLLHKMCLI